jgi:hypothetical protein
MGDAGLVAAGLSLVLLPLSCQHSGLSSGGAATTSPQEERGVDVLARMIRQFADDSHVMTLARLAPLSSLPVIGSL